MALENLTKGVLVGGSPSHVKDGEIKQLERDGEIKQIALIRTQRRTISFTRTA
jgi:hypothetical protein